MVEVKRSEELEARVAESRKAVETGDDTWFADHTADAGDVLFYGTAPGEEWRGRDAVLSLTTGQGRALNEQAGVVEDSDPTVECFEAGDAGWVVVHGQFELPDGSQVPTRSVTFLVRDGDTWKRVFGAAHVLVPNELLVPGSPLAAQPA